MSTHSTITLIKKDGTRKSIHCTYDGYILHNGSLLQYYYDDASKVEKLLELGDLMSLGDSPKTCQVFPGGMGCVEDLPLEEYNYIFDEHEGMWIVKYRVSKTFKSEYIGGTYTCYDMFTSHLIDELSKGNEDLVDEIVDVVGSFDAMVIKANKQRYIALEEQREEYESWYHAYCD